MSRLSKYLLVLLLCLKPVSSAAMAWPTEDKNSIAAVLLGISYGGWCVVGKFKQEHQRHNGPLLRDEINKATAKAILSKPEAQQEIRNLAVDQKIRKQEFFSDNDRVSVRNFLIRAGFAKKLHDKNMLHHLDPIVKFLALSDAAFNLQSLRVEKLQLMERLGLRERLLRDERQKKLDEQARLKKIEHFCAVTIPGIIGVWCYDHDKSA